jgi:hypothetical protein
MLLRIVLENLLSFGEQKEFSMIPYGRLQTLTDHCMPKGGIELLKMASIYGANGAGKSNLFRAVRMLQSFVVKEESTEELSSSYFKFFEDGAQRPQLVSAEFFANEQAYYYALELVGGIVRTEELYLSGLGKGDDQLLFERKTDNSGVSSLRFDPAFEQDAKGAILKEILLEEFVKPTRSVLKVIAMRDNKLLGPVRHAFDWFEKRLVVVLPNSRPRAIVDMIDRDRPFKDFAEQTMCAFNLGISSIRSERIRISEYFGRDDEEAAAHWKRKLEESPDQVLGIRTDKGEELAVVLEDEEVFVKRLILGHQAFGGREIDFRLSEESDGTRRLLDFVPMLKLLATSEHVFLVDEIERSIHPLLIKELIQKFSHTSGTLGQLIFSTHESNLLDQQIFRQDEIWFAEKDSNASTDLYSLSEFKEHKTIDIRKGYLSGRYGAVPFLADVEAISWV